MSNLQGIIGFFIRRNLKIRKAGKERKRKLLQLNLN